MVQLVRHHLVIGTHVTDDKLVAQQEYSRLRVSMYVALGFHAKLFG
jgi:hypothetical protein